MRFTEAFELLFVEGKKIRRKKWGESHHLYPSGTWFVGSPVYPCYGCDIDPYDETEFYSVNSEDFDANDWEIYEDA